jgi:hypothetical protein
MAIKVQNYVTFVSLLPKNAAFTVGSYYDNVGNRFFLHGGENDKGDVIPYKIKFTRNKRHVRFHKDKVDSNNINYVWFLRNHPRCLGSPFNLPAELCWFKEADSEKDAEIALKDFELKNQAETYALNLKGDEFERVAALLGFQGNKSVVHSNIVHYASKDPSGFLEKIKDPNMKFESMMRKALAEKVITKRGFRFTYNDVHLGNNEQEVITKLAEDKELFKAIEKAVQVSSGSK